MVLRYVEWLEGSEGTIAVLCKTAVARKILLHIWRKKNNPLRAARIYEIDATGQFGAAVDACFFVLQIEAKADALSCEIFNSLNAKVSSHALGFLDGHVISDVATFSGHRNLLGPESRYIWRSGIRHDCSKVMELRTTLNGYQNG